MQVLGHGGTEGNELADQLEKQVLDIHFKDLNHKPKASKKESLNKP
jgi:hypothetical protein